MSQEAVCSKNMRNFEDGNEATKQLEKAANLNEDNEEMNNYDDDVPEFMDHFGNHWDFACKIRDGNHLKKCCRIMGGGMVIRKETKLIRRFQCQMNKECQFKAIFVKPSFLYTLNVHNHQRENTENADENENDDEEPSFMDELGNLWNFACKIRNKEHLEEWCQQIGLLPGNEEKLIQQFDCQINECQFKAILLKASSTMYTRNEHNHGMEIMQKKETTPNVGNHGMENAANIPKRKRGRPVKIPKNVGDDYVDFEGKTWTFREEIGKNVQRQILHTNFGFTKIREWKTILNLRCQKKGPNGEHCKFRGIYLKENGCLYTREEHNHGMENVEIFKKGRVEIPKNIGDDYVDFMSKKWAFREEIGKNGHHELLRTKYGLTLNSPQQCTLNLRCQRKGPNGKFCKFKGIYVKENGCLYTRGEHEHKK